MLKIFRSVGIPVALLGFCWALLSLALSEQLLPGPWLTLKTLAVDVQNPEIWLHLGATLARVAVSFLLAMVLGTVAGILMGLVPWLDEILNPLLVVGLNIPMLVISVILYIALGLNEMSAILAVALNKIPIVVVMLREGTRALNPKYFELASSFRVPYYFTFKQIIFPQLIPYILAAARSGLSLVWKIVLVVEFLGRGNGIGFQIHMFFQDYDMAHILSYTTLFVCVMLSIDYGLMQRLDKGLLNWSERHGRGN